MGLFFLAPRERRNDPVAFLFATSPDTDSESESATCRPTWRHHFGRAGILWFTGPRTEKLPQVRHAIFSKAKLTASEQSSDLYDEKRKFGTVLERRKGNDGSFSSPKQEHSSNAFVLFMKFHFRVTNHPTRVCTSGIHRLWPEPGSRSVGNVKRTLCQPFLSWGICGPFATTTVGILVKGMS